MKAPPKESFPLERILFENEACLAINKLPGESSEFPLTGTGENGDRYSAPVHRLDTPASGCLLLAKTPEAAAFLGAAFAKNTGSGQEDDESAGALQANDKGAIKKLYWAITEMPPDGIRDGFVGKIPAEGELAHWIYENKKMNKSFALPWKEGKAPYKKDCPPPKKAVLRCRMVGQGDRYLFLEIALVTGRHHQIRAQLAALGLHIKGDLKYGAKRSEKTGGIRLHAHSLAFPNPLDPGEIILVNADPPLDDALWRAFAEANTGFKAQEPGERPLPDSYSLGR